MGHKILEVQETVNKDFNFCQDIFAPPSKWRPWPVPCLPYPRYATDHYLCSCGLSEYQNFLECDLIIASRKVMLTYI